MHNTALHLFPPHDGNDEQPMRCSPNVLVALLVTQWKKLTRQEIEATYYRKRSIAKLIEKKTALIGCWPKIT